VIPISLRSFAILSSHLRLGLPRDLFPVMVVPNYQSSSKALSDVPKQKFKQCEVMSGGMVDKISRNNFHWLIGFTSSSIDCNG
jgi:hypothetical protein